ncbi:colicin immunity domain-containing protein [Streptomyces sp. MST-110588]|uniref:colicin immunity domain-containing protein n=1 Tax=Streptomyces sp. MST-110588 TaxID=2833628 RepID=UPI001F5D5CD7|nr:colicin immunity domain-containing protein [Streptomyces sp. MST-110588]UNO41072.1 hypothetical protein KGS77_17620 [Streptomyces sp. MST-110588]
MTYQLGADVTRNVLSSGSSYAQLWLRSGKKRVAPLAVNGKTDLGSLRRMVAGCWESGADEVLLAHPLHTNSSVPVMHTAASVSSLQEAARQWRGHLLLVSSSFDGALLFPAPGYALIAGDCRFLSGAVSEGIDQARANFSRYAKRVESKWPSLTEIARSFPPRKGAWSKPDDVATESGTAEQLNLMRSLADGRISPTHFAADWTAARRRAMKEGDRVRSPLSVALNEVFCALEDYSIDPAYKEPEDLTDEELVARVREVLDGLVRQK